MKAYKNYIILLFILIIITGCKKEEEEQPVLTIDKLTGYVQKGPYINGTAITVAELNSNLNPTGNLFSTQILDNKGTFVISEVELESPYVEMRADGFYYDEVKGEKSSAQLTLFGIADVSDHTTINVNILTQLEKGRVEYLLGEEFSFEEAKSQAQADVLGIFGIEYNDMSNSEQLDISRIDEENAILLAISLIVQGNGSVGDLTELLANINTDIREDGVLNSTVLDSMLVTQAYSLKLDEIRKNLTDRYKLLGVEASISDFEKYISNFLPGHLDITYLSSEITCYGQNDGMISATVSGGTAPYSYKWSNGETGESISNLGPGNYSLTVTDSRFYSSTINNITISQPDEIVIITNSIVSSEYEMDNGSIDITVEGGNAPYEYRWSNNSSSQDMSNLSPGSYSLQVSDVNQCTGSSSFQVFEEAYIVKDVSCKGYSDGAINVMLTSGTPPYSFQWSNGETTEDLEELPAGSYSVTIEDANNESFKISNILVSEPDEIKILADITDIPLDEVSGAIDITVSGGTSPYSYTWSNGEISEDISNIQIGSYEVEVVDANACVALRSLAVSGFIIDDRDGKAYKVASIGDQVWLAENMAYLPGINLPSENSPSDQYYYVYDYYGTDLNEAKASENYQKYGVLYNWPASMNVCPDGWHLPSDQEWKELEKFLGMSQEEADQLDWRGTNEGNKLKSYTAWGFDDNANNESGFSALPGGGHWNVFGEYGAIGEGATWWSSTEIDVDKAYNRLIYSGGEVFRYEDYKRMGYSVRCVKDQP